MYKKSLNTSINYFRLSIIYVGVVVFGMNLNTNPVKVRISTGGNMGPARIYEYLLTPLNDDLESR